MSDPNDRWKRFVFGQKPCPDKAVSVSDIRGRVRSPTSHERDPRARAILEDDWQAQVEQYATLCGWTHYHTRDSRGSTPGFPDLVLLRRRRPTDPAGATVRMVVAELKREDEEPTPAQQVWLEYFEGAGAETYIWRPSNFEGMTRVLR